MHRIVLPVVTAALVVMGSLTAQAEPLRLTGDEMDAVTAGSLQASARSLFWQAATGIAGGLYVAIDASDNNQVDGSVLDSSADPTLRRFSTRLFLFAANRGFFN